MQIQKKNKNNPKETEQFIAKSNHLENTKKNNTDTQIK